MATLSQAQAKNSHIDHGVRPSLLVGQDTNGNLIVLNLDSNGNLTVTTSSAGFGFTQLGDAVVFDSSGSNSDAYILKSGGVSGTTLQTITVTYTDSNKSVVSNWVRT